MDSRRSLIRTVLALALLLAAMRVPALLTPIPKVDEALYAASAARSVAFGDPLPYRASWQDKGPVMMWIYMAVFWLFGNYNLWALHLAAMAFVGLGAIAAYLIGKAASNRSGGTWAAFLYIVAMHTGNAIPFNSETPAAIATLWALALLVRLRDPARPHPGGMPAGRAPVGGGASWFRDVPLVFAAGALGGLAFFTRQNYLLLIAALPACVVLLVWQRGGKLGEMSRLSAATIAGFIAPCAAIVGIFAAAGEYGTFVNNFWTMNTIYVGAVQMSTQRWLGIPNEVLRMFMRTAQTPVVIGLLGIGLLVAAPLGRGIFDGQRRIVAALAALMAIGFTLAGIMGMRFFSHYFVMAAPFWAVLAGATISTLLDRVPIPGVVPAAKFAIVMGLALDLSSTNFFETWLDTLRFSRYGGLQNRGQTDKGLGLNDDVSKVCNVIRPLRQADDTLFVWGFSPFFYLQTELIPATRIVNGCYLSGLVPWENVAPEIDSTKFEVPGAWDAVMQDLEASRPAFLVDASRHFLFASGKYPISKYPKLDAFVRGNYVKVRRIAAYDLWIRKDRVPEGIEPLAETPDTDRAPAGPAGVPPEF